jgi:hypothetical protein
MHPSPLSSSGNGGGNYTVTTLIGTGSIIPHRWPSAVADSKVYDGISASAAATPTVSGLQGTDSVSALSQRFDAAIVGAVRWR